MAEFLATFQVAYAAPSVVTGLKPCALCLWAFSPVWLTLEKRPHPPRPRLRETKMWVTLTPPYMEKGDCPEGGPLISPRPTTIDELHCEWPSWQSSLKIPTVGRLMPL